MGSFKFPNGNFENGILHHLRPAQTKADTRAGGGIGGPPLGLLLLPLLVLLAGLVLALLVLPVHQLLNAPGDPHTAEGAEAFNDRCHRKVWY